MIKKIAMINRKEHFEIRLALVDKVTFREIAFWIDLLFLGLVLFFRY